MRMVMVEIGNEVVFINPRYVESIDYSLSKKRGCYEVRITTACKTWTLRRDSLHRRTQRPEPVNLPRHSRPRA